MKTAARFLYLSLFALWDRAAQCQSPESARDACAISPIAIVDDACASYSTLERLNRAVKPAVDDLTRTTDFFSYYRVNLFHTTCPFWDDANSMCGNIACAVETLDNEEEIPEVWRASQLGKLEGPRANHPGKSMQRERPHDPLQGKLGEDVGESCVVEYDDECDDRDYCVPDDERAGSKGEYVSLLRNPERYTGYAGDGAHQVWESIYRENCFQTSSFPSSAGLDGTRASRPNPAAFDFKAVMDAAGRRQVLEQERQSHPLTPFVAKTGREHADECLEKRVFYRVVSGMHASISVHICRDYLNTTTGAWGPNTQCFVERLHTHPERVSNLYFNYALLTRAIAKLGAYLADADGYRFCMGDAAQDAATRAKVLAVAERAASEPLIFDESLMFKNGEGPSLKEDFRIRFRNVSRLMDCVGCDKCRLWGKLQTAGYGAALKVLFEFDNHDAIPVLKRTELVAMFNTYARLSNSLDAVVKFRHELETDAHEAAAVDAEKVNKLRDQARNAHKVVVPAPSDPEPAAKRKSIPRSDGTLKEEFDHELGRVIKAFKFVMKSWLSLPQTLWHVLGLELLRLWQMYIGLPVSPRDWTFERPNIDEL
ncbi:hypothetical protein P8C59_008073 [Phyllachora maydis]|uniref:Endoplasmic oxidoreductin n=1 Tax=Phyllachora maydis TaxID=1825666 RepID=A0AAD9IAS1_9PEZI|nr:hypothetical protein P8C59_008073 [Phyllachora maydis]